MKKIKIFGDKIEAKALAQFHSAMEQDYAVKGALMPDAHVGYALPIGAVIATKDVVVPAWVGYDIGCGMCALPTDFSPTEIKRYSSDIFRDIYDVIPVGFQINKKPAKSDLDPSELTSRGQKVFQNRKGARAIGSLGSGNHFIEIGVDEEKQVWIIIHSGSRGVGHGIATEYMKLAGGGKAREEHCGLTVDSVEGREYINDLNWALRFALVNRYEMMHRIVAVIQLYTAGEPDWERLINRNHNHAEERDGLWIHRKGATHAEKDMMGVVPGNMRDGSFIVCGKGNPDSLYSSSHGAGRVLGRNQAKKSLSKAEFEKTMHGIVARVGKRTIDESPMVYKDIFEVMRLQAELVDVVAHVRPIINVKG